jgi:hypothetical protein
VPSTTSFASAQAGRVGQSLTYVLQLMNDGATVNDLGAVDPAATGHQFFPDIDAFAGKLAVVWQDNRTDDDYSVQLPIGNEYTTFEGEQRAISSGRTEIVNTYASSLVSVVGGFTPSIKVSTVGHQSAYEMFSSRQIPFHGDYNWISIATRADDTAFAYMSWTDNRNVDEGDDPRELAEDGFDDNFDVEQCRVDLGATETTGVLSSEIPLARRDAPFSGDNCGNAGGLDQDIYGATLELGAAASLTTSTAASASTGSSERGTAGKGKKKGKK